MPDPYAVSLGPIDAPTQWRHPTVETPDSSVRALTGDCGLATGDFFSRRPPVGFWPHLVEEAGPAPVRRHRRRSPAGRKRGLRAPTQQPTALSLGHRSPHSIPRPGAQRPVTTLLDNRAAAADSHRGLGHSIRCRKEKIWIGVAARCVCGPRSLIELEQQRFARRVSSSHISLCVPAGRYDGVKRV